MNRPQAVIHARLPPENLHRKISWLPKSQMTTDHRVVQKMRPAIGRVIGPLLAEPTRIDDPNVVRLIVGRAIAGLAIEVARSADRAIALAKSGATGIVGQSRVRVVIVGVLIVLVPMAIAPMGIVRVMKVRVPPRQAWEAVDLAGAVGVEALGAAEALAPAAGSEAHAADSPRRAAAPWGPCQGADLECRRPARLAAAQA
jgi:hypothetical protein